MGAPSPFSPSSYPHLPPIPGVRLAAGSSGIRYKNRADLLLVELSEGTNVAGVFTRSLTASSAVHLCRKHLAKGKARALVVNSGNANAFTGRAGEESTQRVLNETCKLLGCEPNEFFMSSTGVIGEKLPDHLILKSLPELKDKLSAEAWEEASEAIMTTDTFRKVVTHSCEIGGTRVTINGIAKGSGMIAPDMATMLAYIFTDAAIPSTLLQQMLSEANERSFNSITVDSDTSTSDTALLFATGKAGNPAISQLADPRLSSFRAALKETMVELAHQIVKDGEGATKFVTVVVTGAENDSAAKRIALSIANSPLVKTAIAGEDANWGRIVAAVGKAGERANRDQLRIHIGDVCVTENGEVHPEYRESLITEHMKGREIDIAVDVGIASGKATVWTCDLTHGYIDINGSYRS